MKTFLNYIQNLSNELKAYNLQKKIGLALSEYSYENITKLKIKPEVIEKFNPFFYVCLKTMIGHRSDEEIINMQISSKYSEEEVLKKKIINRNKNNFKTKDLEKIFLLINMVEKNESFFSELQFPYKDHFSSVNSNKKKFIQLWEDLSSTMAFNGFSENIAKKDLEKLLTFSNKIFSMHHIFEKERMQTNKIIQERFSKFMEEQIQNQVLREMVSEKPVFKKMAL